MYRIIFALCFQVMINNAIAQYTIGPNVNVQNQLTAPQTQISKQQLINYLLSNSAQSPLPERLEMLTSAVQQMPPRKNNRVYLADALKQSALQNLMVAASVCGEATTANSPHYATHLPSYATPLPSYATPMPSYSTPLTSYASTLPSYATPRRNVLVANAPEYATPILRDIGQPITRRNAMAAIETPLFANRELLSSLLPREMLSSLFAGDFVPNRAARLQYA